MAVAQGNLNRLQVGVETTRFTAVAATRYISTTGATWTRAPVKTRFPVEGANTLAAMAQPGQIATDGTEITWPATFSFEDVLLPLLSGVRGGVTPTTPMAAQPMRLWTFQPQRAASPNPTPLTFETVIRDGSATYAWQTAGAWCDSFEIAVTADALPTISATFMGDPTVAGITAASLSPVDLTRPSSAISWGLYRNSSWATAGDTLVSDRVQSATLSYGGALRGDRSGRVKHSGGWTGVDGIAGRNLTLNATVLLDPTAAALLRAEETARAGGDPSIWRLRIEGPAIMGSNRYYFDADLAGEHLDDSMAAVGPVVDGLQTLTLNLQAQEYDDGTTTRDMQFAVQNIATGYP